MSWRGAKYYSLFANRKIAEFIPLSNFFLHWRKGAPFRRVIHFKSCINFFKIKERLNCKPCLYSLQKINLHKSVSVHHTLTFAFDYATVFFKIKIFLCLKNCFCIYNLLEMRYNLSEDHDFSDSSHFLFILEVSGWRVGLACKSLEIFFILIADHGYSERHETGASDTSTLALRALHTMTFVPSPYYIFEINQTLKLTPLYQVKTFCNSHSN